MSKNGFTPIIFILGVLIASGLIVGGSFYIKRTYFKNSPKIAKSSDLSESSTMLKTLKPQFNLGNKVIFTDVMSSKGRKIHFVDPDGENVQELKVVPDIANKDFNIYASPDNSKLLISVFQILSVKQQGEFNNLLANQLNGTMNEEEILQKLIKFQDSIEVNYFLSSLDEKDLQSIDLNKIKKDNDNLKYIFMPIWSADNKKIVFMISNYSEVIKPEMILAGATPVQLKAIEYDTLNFETKVLVDNLPLGSFVSYYDPLKKVLVYFKPSILSKDSRYLKLNLLTKTEMDFATLNTNNKYTVNQGVGDYFVGFEKPTTNFDDSRELLIYSLDDPTKPISKTPKLPDRYYFHLLGNVTWSPKYNYFATVIENDRPGYNIEPQKNKLVIYQRNGELVGSWPFSFEEKNNYIIADTFYNGLFSQDEKHFLFTTYPLGVQSQKQTWRVIDISSGKIISEVSSLDLGPPSLWHP